MGISFLRLLMESFVEKGKGGFVMHDYVRGAFEALSWVRLLLLDLQAKPDEAVKEALKEIDAALDDIKTGVAGDFRWRLRVH